MNCAMIKRGYHWIYYEKINSKNWIHSITSCEGNPDTIPRNLGSLSYQMEVENLLLNCSANIYLT